MKKILGLAFGLFLSVMTFAQSHVSFNDANDSYDKAATTEFHFTFDASFTAEDLNKSASFYTDYFAVAVTNEASGFNVTITLVQDDEMSRRVISRYLVSNSVQEIAANGQNLTLDEFMGEYILP